MNQLGFTLVSFLKFYGINPEDYIYIESSSDNRIFKHKKSGKIIYLRY